MSDPIQPRKHTAPVYAYASHANAYLNVTNRCTLRCRFCPKFNGSWSVQGYPLRIGREPLPNDLLDALGDPCEFDEVVFCGLGEPTLRLDTLLATARALHEQGTPVRINTDGLANLVHERDVTPELRGLVDALSVSLNAQDEDTYNRHCRPMRAPAYRSMLDFVARARDQVPRVTVTAIDGLPGVDIEACARIADRLGVTFRRRILDQVG